MLQDVRKRMSELPRGTKRAIIAVLMFLDANYLGTLNGIGTLNLVDSILGGSLPNDMVWLAQLVQSIIAGFLVVKIFFDDLPKGYPRTIAILLSPLFLLLIVFISLDLLLQGLGNTASFTLDLVSITTGTLTWSSTYLAIAIGLTLTYKVQRYGNFAQSELFMIGMYLSMIMIWSDYFFPLANTDSSKDGVLTWSVLIFVLVAAFVLTGLAGIIIDRLVYRGFRKREASPQVMMIASLGVALIIRSLAFLRFGNGRNIFEPEGDWRMPQLRWEIPTTKLRFNLGERTIDEEGRTYTQFSCEQTGFDEETGEPILTRIVSETSRPMLEMYDTTTDCITQATTNYAYHKGAVPAVIFSSVLILLFLLNKTRLGRRMRAVADNPELAASSGINVERVQLTSAFLSAGISGLGGAIFAMTLRYNPETAFGLLLPSFAIIVLGTIGSIPGAIVGSLIVGFVRSLSSPVLIGIGLPLGRSNYSALDGVMPYIFLVAILMIMPEGIGNAYEEWKIERLRKRKQESSERSDKIAAILAIMPTGIFGLHHLWKNRKQRMQTFSLIAIVAYAFHRFSDFVGRNSFADGACSDACQSSDFAETNLALLTSRNDGTLYLEDSPLEQSEIINQLTPPSGLTPFEIEQWIPDAVSDVHESWYNMMKFEIELSNLIVDLGDVIWPGAIIALWIYSVYEGFRTLSQKDQTHKSATPLPYLQNIISSVANKISEVKTMILTKYSELDRRHEAFTKKTKNSIMKNMSSFIEKTSDAYQAINSQIIGIVGGSEDSQNSIQVYGRESNRGSWLSFSIFMGILILFLLWLPIAESDNFTWKKIFQVSNVLLTLSIFILMSFSLNLHTGYTGMVNFGVIFFVSIGAITVGILTAPRDLHGYGWDILPATLLGVLLAGLFGWLLAYPTARLRTDYFAIVTISLGEIVRVLLGGEPLLRVGSVGSSIGIAGYPLPLEKWWFCGSENIGEGTSFATLDDCRESIPVLDESGQNVIDGVSGEPMLTMLESPASWVSDLLSLGEPAPYIFLLMSMAVLTVLLVWKLLSNLLSSPWGRVLKAIREDEDVAQHHGHDILTHKAASLALGASIAGLAGAFWAWKLTGFEPSFMSPARSTFLVWAAFIIGGTSNNRGMVIGAFIIVLMEFVFNVLVAGQGSPDLPLYTTAERIDRLFEWLFTSQWEVVELFLIALLVGLITRSERMIEISASGAAIFSFAAVSLGRRSIEESFFGGVISADMIYVKLLLVGCLMLFSLKFNSKGLLPEVPMRPKRPFGGDNSE